MKIENLEKGVLAITTTREEESSISHDMESKSLAKEIVDTYNFILTLR